jgi:DNA-binding NtrC family response regulator
MSVASPSDRQSILIIDRSRNCGWRLRNALMDSGAAVHVFHAFAPALALLRTKIIDTAVVEFDTDRETIEFCKEAHASGVPLVYSTAYAAKKNGAFRRRRQRDFSWTMEPRERGELLS